MRYVLAIFTCLVVFSLQVFAQQSPITDSFYIELSPAYPRPNTTVNLEIQSTSISLDSANIKWIVDGVVVGSGIGAKKQSITVGDIGKRTVVSATVSPRGTFPSQQTITIIPSQVDMVWESLTYTPPLYEGKAQTTKQSDIRILAVPNMYDRSGRKLDPATLIYNWKVNDKGQVNMSGYGKNSMTFKMGVLEERTLVEVTITNSDKTVTGYGSAAFEAGEPRIVLYEKHPQLGLLTNKALGTEIVSPYTGYALSAVPYFFSVAKVSADTLNYTWVVNNTTQATKDQTISLNYPQESQGFIPIIVKIQNNDRVFQRGEQRSTVTVGAAPDYKFEF